MANLKHIRTLLFIPLLALGGCRDESIVNESEEEASAKISIAPQYVSGITSGIRALGFAGDNHFIVENPTITLSDTAIIHTMNLPVGDVQIVLLANAGAKGNVTSLASPLNPHVTLFTDPMFRLTDAGHGLPEPPKYFYGHQTVALVLNAVPQVQIQMKNLCSKADIRFTNTIPNTIDSVQVYIENAGREILFNGMVSATGTTTKHSFKKGAGNLVQPDTFLLFPSKTGTTPILHAIFYQTSGHTRVFSKTLTGYQFISNKILRFTFDLANVQDYITLFVQLTDWEGTVTQGVNSNLTMTFAGGNPANYTAADVTLLYQYSPTSTYPVKYRRLALQSSGGNLQLSVPLTNLEQGLYKVTNVRLYDTEGSFEALQDTVSFDMALNLNTIPVTVFGRTQYENNLVKQWLKVLDGNNGLTYPGTAIMNQINTNPTLDLFPSLLATMGFTTSTVRGETRVAGLNVSNTQILNFAVPAYISALTQFKTFGLAPGLLKTINLSGIPSLTSVNLAGCGMTSVNVSGCTGLANIIGITSGTPLSSDLLALQTLNCSSTSIQVLPAGLTNLKYLYWSNCGLPQVAVTVISGYTQLITLDISANQLTDYPNFSTLVGLNTLTTYIVTWNNIVSCALPYMNKFGENNILPQRTGNNWWCP